jgi:hypothetical protein
MTVFIGAMPRQSTEITTSFHLSAAAEASVLPRVLDVFAKLTIIPNEFRAERQGDDSISVHIHVIGLDGSQSEHLAQTLRRIIGVETVLVSCDVEEAKRSLA